MHLIKENQTNIKTIKDSIKMDIVCNNIHIRRILKLQGRET